MDDLSIKVTTNLRKVTVFKRTVVLQSLTHFISNKIQFIPFSLRLALAANHICVQTLFMKKLYTLFFVLLSLHGIAATPTVPASNLNFPQVDGGFFNVAWTAGNGARRIIVCKAGSAVSFRPQNGIDYAENTNFGSGQQVAPGEFVVYDNAFTSFFLTNLNPSTQYFFAVFEYNGSGATTEYLTANFLSGSASTSTIPTTQVSNANFTTITTNSVTFNWTSGNGQRRLIVVREASPVNADPVNSHQYNVNSVFGSGEAIGTGNFTVYNSSSTATSITNLKPGTTYFFSFYEFNGSAQPQYKTPAYTNSVTTRSVPTVPSSNMIVTKIDGKELSFSWTNGNGQRRIIVAKQGSAVAGTPANGTDYAANAVFGTGPTIAAGEFVVYDDNFNATTISGLNPATNYFFKIFEYDGTGVNTTYLTTSTASANASTATTPTVQAMNITASSINGNSVHLTWTAGNGRARILIGRKNLPVSFVPQAFTAYIANSDFGAGTDLGNGNFVLSSTTDAAAIVRNLQLNTNYHFAVYEFNGFNQPIYIGTAAVFNVTTAGSLPVKLLRWEAIANNNIVKLQWTSSSEINTSHFIIERSQDGARYNSIATINAAGNSSHNVDYNFEDKNPIRGRAYYRLKMVDVDGKFEYSTIRTVNVSSTSSAFLVKNPIQQTLEVVASEKSDWQIVNISGQVLKTGKAQIGRTEIGLYELAPGNYWIKLTDGNKATTLPFIKQ